MLACDQKKRNVIQFQLDASIIRIMHWQLQLQSIRPKRSGGFSLNLWLPKHQDFDVKLHCQKKEVLNCECDGSSKKSVKRDSVLWTIFSGLHLSTQSLHSFQEKPPFHILHLHQPEGFDQSFNFLYKSWTGVTQCQPSFSLLLHKMIQLNKSRIVPSTPQKCKLPIRVEVTKILQSSLNKPDCKPKVSFALS